MTNGELPKESTICDVDVKPFMGQSEKMSTTMDKKIIDLKTAMDDLMKISSKNKYFLGY